MGALLQKDMLHDINHLPADIFKQIIFPEIMITILNMQIVNFNFFG